MNAPYSILIIASDFPPLAGTNTQRIQAFAKYLPLYGWTPTIVTRAVEDLPLIDSGELRALAAGLRVVRVRSPDPFARLRRRRDHAPPDIAAATTPDNGSDAATTPGEATPAPGMLWGLAAAAVTVPLRGLLRWAVYLPDSSRPWARAAAAAGIAACGDTDVLLSSGPTYATHLAGLALKRRTGLPWIADFRDLWVGRPGRRAASRWHAYMDRRYERAVVREADHIVVAAPPWVRLFEQRYGPTVAHKLSCITNGYDSDKMQNIEPAASPGGPVFVHTGSMYDSESPAPFLQALARLRVRRPDLVQPVRVRLVGYAGDELPRLRAIVATGDLCEQVAFLGAQSHHRCLAEQMAADVLLLFHTAVHTITVSGKSFEYMATGKPILALIPPNGIQAQILRDAGTATIVPHGDIAATESAVEKMLTGAAPAARPNWPFIRQYDRRNLTGKLAAIATALAAPDTR